MAMSSSVGGFVGLGTLSLGHLQKPTHEFASGTIWQFSSHHRLVMVGLRLVQTVGLELRCAAAFSVAFSFGLRGE